MNELPAGWVSTELSEVLSQIIGGGTPNKANLEYFKGHIPFMTVKDMRTHYPNDTQDKISNDALHDSSAKLIPADTLIISTRMGLGKICRASFATAINQDLKALFVNDAVSKDFLFYWYINNARLIESLGKGTTVKGIRLEVLRSLKLLLPPLNEQKRIADQLGRILDEVNNAKAHLDEIPAILRNFRSSILAHAGSGKLTEDWRKKRNVKLTGWKKRTGQDVFPFITSGSRGWAKYYSEKGPIFLRVGNLNHQTINLDLSHLQHVTPPQGVEGKRTRIELGDILISITADIGMVALISDEIGEAYINQHLCLARQSGEYNGKYLSYYLASPLGGLLQFAKMQKGAIKSGLTLKNIREVSIQIPTLEEQQEIVNRVEVLLDLADNIEEKYHLARRSVDKITQIVFAKAFRGELFPQDPNDEPAAILLERVKAEKTIQDKVSFKKRRLKNYQKNQEDNKMISSVVETLKKEKKPLTAQSLLQKSGYPLDADPEKIEEFFLEIRSALQEGAIIRERVKDEDIFRLAA
jgi:type I restriction enzyme S subunit